MTAKIEISGVDTAKLTVLKEAEKIRLLKAMHAGDKTAREQLITGNLRLVLSICGRFVGRGENPDDLFQVGCIGLMKAIDNFDVSLNLRFSTYAVPMILGEIRRYLRDNNPLRVSRSIRDTAYHAMQAREHLQNSLGREPSVEEIAEEMGLPREEVLLALEAIVEPVSLQEPVFADGGDTIYVMDQVRAPDGEDAWLDEMSLRDTLGKLPAREKKILFLRFLQGHTQMEVAEEIGISQAQVSRLEKGALRAVREIR
ncbi:MAG: RNA polymerase sporulation sigma factor SigG [Oscillospiraceae bacterium]|jgi:RNA polymerase sporulation-specific sigma factor|nr:RNA polymerase sporulation sigma factor SigG [Oscillospiraceae bacterium]